MVVVNAVIAILIDLPLRSLPIPWTNPVPTLQSRQTYPPLFRPDKPRQTASPPS